MKVPHVRPCIRCGRSLPVKGRGLCNGCYQAVGLKGMRDNYPRRSHKAAALVAEFEHLRAAGLLYKQIARRLGYSSAESLAGSVKHARRRLAAHETTVEV